MLQEIDGRYYLWANTPTDANRYCYLTWELVPGISSATGLLYWQLVALLVPAVLRRRRSPRPALAGTGGRARLPLEALGWAIAAILAVLGCVQGVGSVPLLFGFPLAAAGVIWLLTRIPPTRDQTAEKSPRRAANPNLGPHSPRTSGDLAGSGTCARSGTTGSDPRACKPTRGAGVESSPRHSPVSR